jgi:thiamine pyrophosphate-dependent acetolactate synthase large subunit-like protein
MNVCREIVDALKSHGVNVAFGIPGIHNIPIYRALFENGFDIFTVRHEQSASFMADGYARASGKPVLCVVIDGPGS